MEHMTPELRKQKRRKRTLVKRIVVLALAVVVVLGVITLVLVRRHQARALAMAGVRTTKVTRGTVTQTISATGTVTAETGADVKIGSQITGRIAELNCDVGTVVKPNQIIAVLAAPDLQANLDAARRNADNAQQKYEQQLEGVGMTHTQLSGAYQQASDNLLKSQAQASSAQASLVSARSRLKSAQAAETSAGASLRDAEAKLRSAKANLSYQASQTTTDVQKAQAGLATAQSNLQQVQKSTALEVANSEAALKQAKANATLAASNLKREQALLAKGYASQQDVDTAQTTADVDAQAVDSAQSSLDLTKAKVATDLPVAQAQVTQAKAALVAAKSETHQNTMRTEDVASAEASRDSAKAAVEQAHQTTLGAQADVEAAVAGVHSANLDVQSAKAAQQTALANMTQDQLKQRDVQSAYQAMMQAQAQVRYQEAQFAKSTIRTPIGGTVVTLSEQQGETIAAGLSAPVLVEVVDLDRLEVEAFVDETDIGHVKLGQEAEVQVDAYPSKKFKGHVIKIASAATMQSNVVTYDVSIKLNPGQLGHKYLLKPQMTTDVNIFIQKHENVLIIPNEAVKEGNNNITRVALMVNGKPQVREIKTGLADSDNTEVVSGLKEGDTVVLAGFDSLGLPEFSSEAALPRFFRRTPFGTTSTKSGQKGGKAGQQPGGKAGQQPGGKAGQQPGAKGGEQAGGKAGQQPGGKGGAKAGGEAAPKAGPPAGAKGGGKGGGN